MDIILWDERADQYLTSIGDEMSNSFPERKKPTVLKAFDTLSKKRDYAGGTHPVTALYSAKLTHPGRSEWSTPVDKEAISNARGRAGGTLAEKHCVIAHGRFSVTRSRQADFAV
jgi:hypothetical protein